jgi:hypothetical protein
MSVTMLKTLPANSFKPCSDQRLRHGDICAPIALPMASPINHRHLRPRKSNTLITAYSSAAIIATPPRFRVRYSLVVDALIQSQIFSHVADNKKAGSYVYI